MNLIAAQNWSHDHSDLIQAITACGTWAAVVLSLMTTFLSAQFVRKQRQPKLNVFVDRGVMGVPGASKIDFSKDEKVIMVSMQNIGYVNCYISYCSFFWYVPFSKIRLMLNPYKPDFRNNDIKIEPGQSTSIALTNNIPGLLEELGKMLRRENIPQFFCRFITLKITTSDGYLLKAEFGRTLKQEFLKIKKGKPDMGEIRSQSRKSIVNTIRLFTILQYLLPVVLLILGMFIPPLMRGDARARQIFAWVIYGGAAVDFLVFRFLLIPMMRNTLVKFDNDKGTV